MSKKNNGANTGGANVGGVKNATFETRKHETATQTAARRGFTELEREQKAAEKAAAKETAKAERAAKLAAQKLATAERHANEKSAISYGVYSVVKSAGNTPYAACKRFYILMQTACGGSLCVALQHILGSDKREFAEIYAPRVKAAFESNDKIKNYTDFLVWRVIWSDIKTLTVGDVAKVDKKTAAAINDLRSAIEARKLAK